MKTNTINTKDGAKLNLIIWDEVSNPRLIVQLVHGMCEHGGRYDDFARFLNSKGIIVAVNDLRGHGLSAEPKNYGYEKGDMWEHNIQDQIDLSKMLVDQYNLPLIVMGHSYGSFLTQRLIEVNPIPQGFVLSGSCYMNNLLMKIGAIISTRQANKNVMGAGTTMANMSFRTYEKQYPGVNNWLSRDEKQVEKYNNDPACGYVASNNFYATFMNGLKTIYRREARNSINVNRPIYIFSGEGDPVGEYGKGVKKLYKFYQKQGVKDLTMKLYSEGRHEMLNELNKEEVYNDVYNYLANFMKE